MKMKEQILAKIILNNFKQLYKKMMLEKKEKKLDFKHEK